MKITLFIKNTVILVATSLILRSAGIFFKVWLADRIGSEGIGLYQLIFSVYIFAAAFATSGISTAVTRLVAEEEQNGRRSSEQIMRTAVYITLLVAAVSTSLIFFLAEPISIYILKETRAVLSLKILSLSLPFMALSSCARGYFIAKRKPLQPSMVQLAEQTVRIAVVMICLYFTAHKDLTYCAAAVFFGDTVAEAVSFLINWWLFILDKRKLSKGNYTKNVGKRILHIAVPITLGSYLSSFLHSTENILVPLQLSAFYGTQERGLELFGAIRGMALPILFFPASFLNSLSTMMIPEVSSAAASGNLRVVKETVTKTVSITLKVSIIISAIFMFNAHDLGTIIYHDSDVGQIIAILSPIVPFMYLESVSAGMLKGLDCQIHMVTYNTIDSILRIASAFTLLSVFGIKGYLGIMIISNCLTSTLSAKCLFKAADIKLDFKRWIFTPLTLGLLFGVLSKLMIFGLHNLSVRCVLSVGLMCITCGSYLYFSCKPKYCVI